MSESPVGSGLKSEGGREAVSAKFTQHVEKSKSL